MIFKYAFKKGKKALLKIEMDDGKEKWMETTDAVLKFAENNFKEGDAVDVEYTEQNGKYKATRITAEGESGKKTNKYKKDEENEVEDSTVENVCEDCGKELKSDKYTKCYTCNKKVKENGTTSKTYTKPKSYDGDRNDSIIRQTCIKAASEAVTVLAGHVDDLDTVGDMVIELAGKLYNWVTE